MKMNAIAWAFRCKTCKHVHLIAYSKLKNKRRVEVRIKCPYNNSKTIGPSTYKRKEFHFWSGDTITYKRYVIQPISITDEE